MMEPRCYVRALVVCPTCLPLTASPGAQSTAFPLITTALAMHTPNSVTRLRFVVALLTHLICAAIGFAIRQANQASSLVSGYLAILLGSALMLALQATRLRHPPSLSSGGAVLCGVDPIGVVACAAIAAMVMGIEALAWRLHVRRDE